ncbi:glycoside hydrolase family 3 N-terminal domain-containing protein [Paenibacillus sp. MMS20-IR301]|uniref:glycoside hydrolase family 3 N-terminal domain-containing protein n=1 Tax=Paenibacillus sp. MMS20-IR301 TaxID=2895946 RepID=UPI0028E71D60|nr:glycoside hydrolase family 3 N-terminal domain-containing protein [Paenibacillus sp. MMS20-IR301]WNS44094.1 glycoside hydrolase family 3 N-terminal domain-containing protein [Paenibacillus sp. MMS20-IR301]
MLYRDRTKPAEERTAHLLGLMTTEEKVGQLIQLFGWQTYEYIQDSEEAAGGHVQLTEEFKRRIREGGIGSLYGTLRADPWTGVTLDNGLGPRAGAEAVNAIQRYALEHSRLGIPLLIGEECSHGHMAIGATVFPVPLLIGSTWNVDLYREMCRAVALETRSQGGAVTYSPVLDVVRDPRWGRTEECFGEDPYLIGEFAAASVEGLQGEDLSSASSVGATLKHFVAYGSSEGGRNAGPAHIGKRELLEVDLYPFRKAVEAGAASVMPAYNEIDGVPCTTNKELLQDVLRDEWGFRGMIITDCGAIDMLASGHDTAESGEDAAVQALQAGIDMEMSGEMFGRHLLAALRSGRLAESFVDEAASRVLDLKFRLGLFEQPFADPDLAEAVIGSEDHAELARSIAAEGIVLLKNDGVLPLSKHSGRIAVIGPNADAGYNQLGDYTSPQPPGKVATVLGGIRSKLAAEPERVIYAPGCRIKDQSAEGLEPAMQAAAGADTVVLVLGGSSARDFGEGSIDLRTGASKVTENELSDMDCGEGIDRMSLHLSGIQLELMQQLKALGKPVVVVYINGRPVAEPWIDEHADAILEAWYPGQEGGHAVADILFGDVNPSGRLTVSLPVDAGQLPVYYLGKRSRGARYLEGAAHPRYPFGFGLSYTEFCYSGLRIEPAEIPADGTAEVTVTVENTGSCQGAEVVQLYISDSVSKVTRPAKELKGFRKIVLEPGAKQNVSFTIGAEQLSYIGPEYKPVVEPGDFRVRVGRNVNDTLDIALVVMEE